MNLKNQKKSTFKAQFNSLETNPDDPTILKGTVIIHDFEKSGNNQVISEEVCAENMSTLIGKRITCKYICSEDNNGIDALTSHEEDEGKDRNTGEDIGITNTIAIGFIESVYIDDFTNENGNIKRVLYGNVVIWNDDKYTNIVGLLQEWIDRGVKIHMSVEYLYCNYNVVNGVEHIQSPVLYVAHTFLNSEQRGDYAEILPAWDCATLISLNEKQKWNKAINQLNNKDNKKINNNLKKEEENQMKDNKFFKALCELSHGDIREQLMTALSKTMTADEFYNVWLSSYGVYDTYFVYENYENDKYVYYKVPYTKTETDVNVELDKKVKVVREDVWVEVSELQKSQNALKESEDNLVKANEKITNLEKQLNSANDTITEKDNTIKSLNEEKKAKDDSMKKSDNQLSVEKFTELTNTITSLNSQVKNMQPIVEKYNKEQYEKSLNNAKDFYKEKFEAVDALDLFNTNEIQELVKKSINSNKEESDKAKFTLSEKIIENVKISTNSTKEDIKDENTGSMKISVNSITEPCKPTNNLRKDIDEFKEMYGFSK